MSLNKKSIDDINVKGKRVLVRCDFNVPLKDGKITDENRINGALPTIQKLIKDGGKVILCSHLGKVKNGPNEGESLAPVAAALEAKLGQKVTFVADYNVTGEAATKAVSEMKFFFRIHVSKAKRRQSHRKPEMHSQKSLLTLLMYMYVTLSVLLIEHMLL